ncbi:MAG: TonB-dependent receptor [Bacteroidetes bacterium]|nr:TonB-dependent receptor [Bacteroidota bacterium]
MLKRLLPLLFFFPFCFLAAQDISTLQEGTLKGKIADAKTGDGLGGVSIYIDGKGATVSDTSGNYKTQCPTGTHSVEFKFIGYSTVIHKVDIKENETMLLNLSLSVEATELGTVVVSAGKFEQKLEEVTVSMEVMKQELVENKNTTSMEDFMQQCPGVNILDGQANIRGGSGFSYGAGTRVLVLVDDLPLITADAGDVKWDFIPIENIEQVEVIKGASSALFGSSAMNGVINFRTKYPKDTAHTSVSLSSGFYDNPRRDTLRWWKNQNPIFSNASFFHSRQIKNLDVTVGGNAFSDGGYRQLESTQRYRANFGLRYRFQKIKGLAVGLNGNYMDTHGGYFILWKSGDSAYYPRGGSVSDYHTVRATIDPYITYFTPNGNKHSLRTRYYFTNNTNNTNQQSISKVLYGEYQYQLHLKKELTITSGISETHSEVISESSTTDSLDANGKPTGKQITVAPLYGNHSSTNTGVFTQLDKKFNRLIVSLGLRGEYFKVDTAQTKYSFTLGKNTSTLPVYPVMRAGVNYHLFSHTWLRSSYGQGYRFPSVAEKFISTNVNGLQILPNPQLQPETGWSAEIGAKQDFKIRNFRGYVDVAGFWQEYKNMMEFTFDYWCPQDSVKKLTGGNLNFLEESNLLAYVLKSFGAKSINVGHTQIKGEEITMTGEGMIGKVKLSMIGGYTHIHPIDLDYDSTKSGGTYKGNILKYRYEHTAKFDVQADYKKFSTGISMRYSSFMKNIDESFQKELLVDVTQAVFPNYHTNFYVLPGLKEYREKHNKGDVVFDYRISYWISKTVKTSIVVNNVFNREYMGRPGDVQPPRTYAVVLSAKI